MKSAILYVLSLLFQAMLPALIEASKDTACDAKRDAGLEEKLRAKIKRDWQ